EFLSARLFKPHGTVEAHLEKLGVPPDFIDYITFDHLHVQDLRRWFGENGGAGVFPRARLLVMRDEWACTKGLHPLEYVWYVPQGCDGFPESRVVLLDGDTSLGRGVALVRTPGHTYGNHTIALNTDSGVWTISEN